jgi:hypothetical protein
MRDMREKVLCALESKDILCNGHHTQAVEVGGVAVISLRLKIRVLVVRFRPCPVNQLLK